MDVSNGFDKICWGILLKIVGPVHFLFREDNFNDHFTQEHNKYFSELTADEVSLGYLSFVTLVSIVTWKRGIFHDNITTLRDTLPTQRSLTPDKSDVSRALHKSQWSNSYVEVETEFLKID
jgi:hypothetical protein